MRALLCVTTAIGCVTFASIGLGQDAGVSATAASDPQVEEREGNPTQEVAGEQAEGHALEVGPTQLRFGGYLGVTGIYRSTNSGGSSGTSFASIPYEDTLQGNVGEARLSTQSSRISMRVDSDFPEAETRFDRISGYFELDFGGSTPGTVAVTSTSFGLRMRQGFAEAMYRERFLFAAGQAFSLMTAHKDQLSIWPSDAELSQAVDTNYLAGTIWNRSPQIRFTWRPSARINWAVSLENPEQQIGKGLVTLPECCVSDLDAQYNTGSDELKVPNRMPDFVTRAAFNPSESLHIDVGAVARAFRHTVAPYEEDFEKVGWGASVNARFNATASTKLLLQTGYGPGFGRYVGGLVPDVAFRSDGSISPIKTTSWVGGVEQRVSAKLSFAGYYSGVKAESNFDLDTGGSYIGFGYPGAANTNNRKVQELSGTASYQFLKSADRGSGQINVQVSWVEREPLSQGIGPASAEEFMVFAQVRYNLP
jgi:hypothetical protein